MEVRCHSAPGFPLTFSNGHWGHAGECSVSISRDISPLPQALGLKPKEAKPLAPAALDKQEMAKLLHGNPDDQGEGGPSPHGALGVPGVDPGSKVSGLGFKA